MKTVVHLSTSHVAFDDRIFFKEAITLKEEYRVIIIAGGKNGKLETMGGEQMEPAEYNGVFIYPLNISKNISLYYKIRKKLLQRLNIVDMVIVNRVRSILNLLDSEIDILHIHDPDLIPIAIFFKKMSNIKIVFDCHEFFYLYPIAHRQGFLAIVRSLAIAINQKKFFKFFDAIISVTNTMRVINESFSPSSIHEVIYNASLLTAQDYKITSPRITLIFEGSLTFNRGLDLMIQLMKDSKIRTDCVLRIVGELRGNELEYFEIIKKTEPYLDGAIEITGWIPYEKLEKHLVGHIGLILSENQPNNYMGLPNKLFNYLARGIPVISVPMGEVASFIEGTGAGVICDRSVESIKEAIMTIRANYEHFQAAAIKASPLVSWATQAEKLKKLYNKIG